MRNFELFKLPRVRHNKMEIRLPKELSLFFWILVSYCLWTSEFKFKLPSPKVAPDSTNQSWGVVENFTISCALKLHRAPRRQNLNSPLVGAKCLLIGHHHLLEEAAHAKEVVHDSRRRQMRSRRSASPECFFLDFLLSCRDRDGKAVPVDEGL